MIVCSPHHSHDLNTCCAPGTLRPEMLASRLAGEPPADEIIESATLRPGLFAGEQVYLNAEEFARMRATVSAVEKVRHTSAYLHGALENVDPGFARDPGTDGVFGSYDFHMAPGGPKLIEVNTNAGGAFLAAAAAKSHALCCGTLRSAGPSGGKAFEDRVVDMFLREWRASGRAGRPAVMAIVDDAPENQFLYPEFLIFQKLFERQGMRVMILDPSELSFVDGRLVARHSRIDLVYNRLTDFYFASGRTAALREAVLTDAAVVTPHPYHHAVLAQKTNLVRLGEAEIVGAAGLTEDERQALALIPETRIVNRQNAETLWAERKSYYFKPIAGHAAKGVYRGAKITRSAWAAVVEGGYVAQKASPPGHRLVHVDGADMLLKADFRVYTYGAEILLVTARLYQGQTTNMRTPGGGFAPVIMV